MDTAKEWINWFVKVNNPSVSQMWSDNPTYLVANWLFITMACLSLLFGLRRGIGSRYVYIWVAALLHGVVTEMVCYNLPDINNFWHSQTFMIFAGRRFPLYIVIFYPATVVHAYVAASRLRLPWWAEPFAVGLFDVLIDFPYDILGIKMVWWTWHDTDPNIYDRTYWVPWTSYFFHMSFHSSLAFLINGTRRVLTGNADKDKATGFFKEMLCVLITGALSMGLAIASQILPIYHGLKDGFGIHSEIIMMIVFGLYIAIVWYADRMPKEKSHSQIESDQTWWLNETGIAVLLHYIVFMVLVVVAKPSDVISNGLHEPIGPKHETVDQYAASGVLYTKQRYFDPSSYDEGYIDFHCVPGGAPNISSNPELIGQNWYTVCGTPFENHYEYIVIIWSFCLLGMYAFYVALARSSTQKDVDEPSVSLKALRSEYQKRKGKKKNKKE